MLSGVALSAAVVLGTCAPASADEADAKRLLGAMSSYMAAQKAFSFEYDTVLEVVTADDQKLALASSGSVSVNRPDKLRAARHGGFADVEMSFDGKTLTLFGKNLNADAQVEAPGSIDNLIDVLRDKYHRPLPAADLLLANAYDALMDGVVDVKDLGSGVVGGVECDYLAFRAEEVDWQIWIAQGDRPYPCRYVITSKGVQHGPQYSIQFRNWRTGNEVAATDYAFKEPAGATQIEFKEFQGKVGDLPESFSKGASQ